MRAVLIVILAAGVGAACAPVHGAYGPGRLAAWPSIPASGPSVNLSDVTGRWDNVMMLPGGVRIVVLRMDGARADGDFVSASAGALRLAVASGEIEMAVDDIARVDSFATADRSRRILSGAAHGVGAVGVLGLIAGRMPPARLFAAGAIVGAEGGAHGGTSAGAQTIYLSPRLRR